MCIADQGWAGNRIVSGLSSGEGLISQVRDAMSKTNKEGDEVVDRPGGARQTLLVVEEEFASVLHMIERDGNTLSPSSAARGTAAISAPDEELTVTRHGAAYLDPGAHHPG